MGNFLNMQATRKVLLAISGGIAAYKTPEIVRRLKDRGIEVRVAMTQHAQGFITPLTLQAVSGEPVSSALIDPEAEAAMSHIELAKWPDLIVVAPATANIVAKLSHGLADDLVSTLLLATDAPIAIVPAMNQQMFGAPATQDNLALLAKRGVLQWGPASGEQACGDVGKGRMIEPMAVVEAVSQFFESQQKPQLLAGTRIKITAGPTREAIDPVRYISNHSSGKMGFALAQAAQQLGADVELISGPVNLATPSGVQRTSVTSAQQMLEASMNEIAQCDIFISCAAVADYRVAEVAEQKIKKSGDNIHLSLTKNPDIVASVAALDNKPFTIGFAAETQNVKDYALGKLKAKNLDMIAANDVSNTDLGFNSDNNALSVYWNNGNKELAPCSKTELAEQLMNLVAQHYQKTKPTQ
ncbi:bifunctional phosphopantothenoylcysteine decarboxylase/phosphopantothenate--cysteine ligase CoaBC [Aliagarivorans marinus]|uniref:bifunctional phosphopantothenoylcysteine decarboxylase/phosphopantothenate--cysteine ligase CoaBC n=1 Tax=Aliagarivorans marinus TaxID=561965 RepID=UPI00047D05D7|nr:bifunctional phosphopantothenoylcysteine decarboxylase/phosphopantothenate--cysteine ligase CoaBC [Aliagarivorans marinus]